MKQSPQNTSLGPLSRPDVPLGKVTQVKPVSLYVSNSDNTVGKRKQVALNGPKTADGGCAIRHGRSFFRIRSFNLHFDLESLFQS